MTPHESPTEGTINILDLTEEQLKEIGYTKEAFQEKIALFKERNMPEDTVYEKAKTALIQLLLKREIGKKGSITGSAGRGELISKEPIEFRAYKVVCMNMEKGDKVTYWDKSSGSTVKGTIKLITTTGFLQIENSQTGISATQVIDIEKATEQHTDISQQIVGNVDEIIEIHTKEQPKKRKETIGGLENIEQARDFLTKKKIYGVVKVLQMKNPEKLVSSYLNLTENRDELFKILGKKKGHSFEEIIQTLFGEEYTAERILEIVLAHTRAVIMDNKVDSIEVIRKSQRKNHAYLLLRQALTLVDPAMKMSHKEVLNNIIREPQKENKIKNN